MLTPNILCQIESLALLERIESGLAQLVYLDPPWFSAWHLRFGSGKNLFGETDLYESQFKSYLEWLSKVIQQAKRISGTDGNVVIHTEPDINSYVRVITERIFGLQNVFEIVLPRSKRYGQNLSQPQNIHENLLFCKLSPKSIYVQPYRQLSKSEISQRYTLKDESGLFALVDITVPKIRSVNTYAWNGYTPLDGKSWRYTKDKLDQLNAAKRIYINPSNKRPYLKVYLSENSGVAVGSIWDDISLRMAPSERVDYAAQQPLALLERIVMTTTVENSVVVDPFIGSGTTIVACNRLSRRWIGGDERCEAIDITQERLLRENALAQNDYTRMDEQQVLKDDPFPHNYASISSGLVGKIEARFVLNQKARLEEFREIEFKEIKGANSVSAIANVSDEYAVAFLNYGKGGSIFWGIRNDDGVVIGVSLSYRQRDEVAKAINNKLHQIQPPVTPSVWQINFHQVVDSEKIIEDLVVVELQILPVSQTRDLYGTGSGEAFLKTDSGKKKLSFLEMQAEIRNRSSRTRR